MARDTYKNCRDQTKREHRVDTDETDEEGKDEAAEKNQNGRKVVSLSIMQEKEAKRCADHGMPLAARFYK